MRWKHGEHCNQLSPVGWESGEGGEGGEGGESGEGGEGGEGVTCGHTHVQHT